MGIEVLRKEDANPHHTKNETEFTRDLLVRFGLCSVTSKAGARLSQEIAIWPKKIELKARDINETKERAVCHQSVVCYPQKSKAIVSIAWRALLAQFVRAALNQMAVWNWLRSCIVRGWFGSSETIEDNRFTLLPSTCLYSFHFL